MFGRRSGVASGCYAALSCIFVLGFVSAVVARAQSPQLQERPGTSAAPHPEEPAPLNDYQRSQMAAWASDFADLQRYRAAPATRVTPARIGQAALQAGIYLHYSLLFAPAR